MRLSAGGVWLRLVRPQLGRLRRRVRRVASRVNIAGRPAADAPPPDSSWLGMTWFWIGAFLHRAQRFDHAASVYSRAIRLDGRFPEWHYQLGNAERYRGNWPEALEAYEHALELNPGLHKAHFWLGVGLNRAAATEQVARMGRRSRRQYHTDAADRALARAASACQQEPRYSFWLGVALHYRGRLAEALEAYERAIADEPGHALWHQQAGCLRQQLGDWEGSVTEFEKALDLARIDPDPVITEAEDAVVATGAAVAPQLPSHTHLRELSEAYSLAAVEDVDIVSLRETRKGSTRLENWAAAAVLYRGVAERSDAPASHRYWLGVALDRLGEWPESAAAIGEAIKLDGSCAGWYDRLGSVNGRMGDWQAACDAYEAALALRPIGPRYHRLAVAYQHLGRWRDSSEAYSRAVELEGGVNFSRLRRLGSLRGEMEDWAGAAALYRSALEEADDPRYHFWLGRALAKLGDWSGAVTEYEATIARRPEDPEAHFHLGFAHEHAGTPTPAVHPRLGLVSLNFSDLAAATASYERATELAPGEPRYWMRLGGVQEERGELEAARDSFARVTDLDPANGQAWHRRGRAIAAIANRRGAYLLDEHDELERIWGRALDLAPGLSGSRQQLVRASVKAARWEIASRAAWYPPPWSEGREVFDALRTYVETTETSDIREQLSRALDRPLEELRSVPIEWWFVLHWRLLTDGHFTLGFKAKSIMAEEIVRATLPDPDENLSRFLEVGRALTFLGRYDEALDHLDTSHRKGISDMAELAIRKQAADIELLHGHVEPYASMLRLNKGTNAPETEAAFRRLVEGKRIAVVGPTDATTDHGAEIDDFDVVVRTKFTSDAMSGFEHTAGSRTDLSYYALGSARFLEADIVDAIEKGSLKMAVFRTATYNPAILHLRRPGDLRYVPSEYQGAFRAAQFAIQRIIYDLLRYRPAQVKIFHINFFIDPNSYRPGYLADYVQKFGDAGLKQILGAFGHDFLADFVFTQRLHRAGLVEVDEQIGRLLQLRPAEYLRGLDSRDD